MLEGAGQGFKGLEAHDMVLFQRIIIIYQHQNKNKSGYVCVCVAYILLPTHFSDAKGIYLIVIARLLSS